MNVQKFCVIHQNIQSIGTSLLGLESFAREHKADLIAVTEHWKSVEQLQNYQIDGYRLCSSYCREINKHGGSAIYARHNLICDPNKYFESHSIPKVFECSCVQIKTCNTRVMILCIYRSPSGDIDLFIEKLSIILDKALR